MTTKDVERLQEERVLISRPGVKCQVTGWRYCDKVIQTPTKDGECGCNFKKLTVDGAVEYSFFLYMKEVKRDAFGAIITCELGTSRDDRQMEVVTFSRRPPNPLYACRDRAVVFDWEFNPVRDSIENNFHVYQIKWKSVTKDQPRGRLGFYRRYTDGRPNYFKGIGGSKLITNASVLPQLSLTDLHSFVDVQTVQITVTFHVNSTTFGAKRNSDDYLYRKHLIRRDLDDDEDIDDEENETDTTQYISTTTTFQTTTFTTQTTTIGAVNTELYNTANKLVDTTELIVTDPPYFETSLSFKIVESITGNLVITCQVNHMSSPGLPPVNLTIRRDGKVLVSRPGVTTLHYSTDASGDTLTCGLEGKSLECLNVDDPRRRKEARSIKDDLEKLAKPSQNIDVFLVFYACESIICIMLMLWTLSLCLDHVFFVVRQKRKSIVKERDEYLKRNRPKHKEIQQLSERRKKYQRAGEQPERGSSGTSSATYITNQSSTIVSSVTESYL